jgi:hypothetical protein
MVRSRIPLVALMGAAMGCTQDAAAPDTAYEDDGPSLLQRLKGESSSKGGSVRALTPEERESLLPRPIPVPESMRAQAAAAPESEDAGSAAPDYAEQRRQQYAQRMQQLREDAALRDAGIEKMVEEAVADERLETERFRNGKGSGIRRREIIQIIRDTDGGTQAAVKE